MHQLKTWIVQHQVVSFYLITFAITYGLGFSFKAVNTGDEFLLPLIMIALCSPALTGILISRLTSTQPRQGTLKAFWITFGVGEVLAVIVFLANQKFINQAPLSLPLVLFCCVMVLPVAFIIASTNSRIPAVKAYLGSLIRLRGVWGWCILALFITPIIILLTLVVDNLVNDAPLIMPHFIARGWTLVGLIVVKLLYQFFFFNTTGEECGWRGFAQPHLQTRLSPLVAALILAVFWSPWHFFLWQAEGKPVTSVDFWLEQYAAHIPATFWLVWFYNRSRGSILVAGIMHAAANTTFFFVTNLNWQLFNIVQWGALVILILLDRMWKRLPADHPAVYQGEKVIETGGLPPG